MRLVLAVLLMAAFAAPAATDALVTPEAVATRVADAIAQRLPAPGRYRATLADPNFQLTPPQGRYDIAALTYDPARQTFAATLSYANTLGTTEYVRIAGTAYPVIEVPVLTREIAAGEIVADGDLIKMEMPADRLSNALMTSADAVAGQAARRPLRARAPLYAYDLKKPVVVKKGELIAVVYAMDGIQLTAQAQAQADGGKGDTIPVLNTRSRRTIEARVTGPGVAVVTGPATLAAAQ